MKVCIHYPYRRGAESFEGARLRKTLKGACESVDIGWDDEPSSSTEIAHFLSPLDEKLLLKCKKNGIKTVLSCFYCENDRRASFLKSGGKKIDPRSIRVMNEADLILVPTKAMADLSKKEGVISEIKILDIGVNLDRFSSKSVEANIFPRYFRVRPEEKFVMVVGSYADQKILKSLQKLAFLTPKLNFYFFGARSHVPFPILKNSLMKKSPRNLIYEPVVEDDVYRSALMRCVSYLLLDDEHPDQMALMDAFAAGAEVVAVGDQSINPILKGGENCLVFKTVEEASAAFSRLYLEKDKEIIMAGYAIAERSALPLFAKQLKEAYEKVLSK